MTAGHDDRRLVIPTRPITKPANPLFIFQIIDGFVKQTHLTIPHNTSKVLSKFEGQPVSVLRVNLIVRAGGQRVD